jgi:hypothetical protein
MSQMTGLMHGPGLNHRVTRLLGRESRFYPQDALIK